MAKKTVGVKLDNEWIDHIDRYAQSKGIARSKAIEEAIAQYFNLKPNQPEQPKPANSDEAIAKLTSTITKLTARVEKIEENIKPATNIYKFPTGGKREVKSKESPVKSYQSNKQQPITNNQESVTHYPTPDKKKLNAIARRAEECGMSLEEAVNFAPWLIG